MKNNTVRTMCVPTLLLNCQSQLALFFFLQVVFVQYREVLNRRKSIIDKKIDMVSFILLCRLCPAYWMSQCTILLSCGI